MTSTQMCHSLERRGGSTLWIIETQDCVLHISPFCIGLEEFVFSSPLCSHSDRLFSLHKFSFSSRSCLLFFSKVSRAPFASREAKPPPSDSNIFWRDFSASMSSCSSLFLFLHDLSNVAFFILFRLFSN